MTFLWRAEVFIIGSASSIPIGHLGFVLRGDLYAWSRTVMPWLVAVTQGGGALLPLRAGKLGWLGYKPLPSPAESEEGPVSGPAWRLGRQAVSNIFHG